MAVTDFEPYKGDLVEIEFSEQGDPQSRKATSVKPLKHYHINKVVHILYLPLGLPLFHLVVTFAAQDYTTSVRRPKIKALPK